MATSSSLQIFVTALLLILPISIGQTSFRPDALVLPVRKDASTLQYLITVNQRTPLVAVNLVVHLGGQFMWVDCENNYVSSSYRPALCGSAQCSLSGSTSCGQCFNGPRPGCNNNTCGAFPDNPITRTATGAQLGQDVISMRSIGGSKSNPGLIAAVPGFIFSCATTSLLEGLASGATGLAGLGRARIGFPSQLAEAFSFSRKFAVCLSSSASSTGVIIFGDGPYKFHPGIDVSASLSYTPLHINPVSTAMVFPEGEQSSEYFIGVNTIRINNKRVRINNTLLTIDGEGNGGTKISTVDPYTVLEATIFRALSLAYVREAAKMNISRVSGVGPFQVCFSNANARSTRIGPTVPLIKFVLQGKKSPVWTITGSNSMIQVNDNVMCLGFLDGGLSQRTAIVIGGYQLENNLLQFDLAASRLGFSSTLLMMGRQTTCASFNSTSNL